MKIEKVTLVCITLGDVYSISGSYEHFLSASLTLCELCIYTLFTFSAFSRSYGFLTPRPAAD